MRPVEFRATAGKPLAHLARRPQHSNWSLESCATAVSRAQLTAVLEPHAVGKAQYQVLELGLTNRPSSYRKLRTIPVQHLTSVDTTVAALTDYGIVDCHKNLREPQRALLDIAECKMRGIRGPASPRTLPTSTTPGELVLRVLQQHDINRRQ